MDNKYSTEGTSNYPYWREEFDREFKGYELLYREKGWGNVSDIADAYRVFMILCNQNYNTPRMEIIAQLKNATEENPIKYQNETFWSEKI